MKTVHIFIENHTQRTVHGTIEVISYFYFSIATLYRLIHNLNEFIKLLIFLAYVQGNGLMIPAIKSPAEKSAS